MREAVATLFNFEWSNATLFHGLYTRTDSFWENSTMQAEGLPQGEELAVLEEFRDRLPPEIFTEPAYEPPVMGDRAHRPRALRQAGRLLEAAGWAVGRRRHAAQCRGRTLTLAYRRR